MTSDYICPKCRGMLDLHEVPTPEGLILEGMCHNCERSFLFGSPRFCEDDPVPEVTLYRVHDIDLVRHGDDHEEVEFVAFETFYKWVADAWLRNHPFAKIEEVTH